MKYDPSLPADRKALASAVISALHSNDFSEFATGGERGFSREFSGSDKIEVVVYTSIVGSEVREVDADAIRTQVQYRAESGQTRIIVQAVRVNRVGTIQDIVKRMLDRIREVGATVASVSRCRCGAPMFRSAKKNMVCAERCFDKPASKPDTVQAQPDTTPDRYDDKVTPESSVARLEAPRVTPPMKQRIELVERREDESADNSWRRPLWDRKSKGW